MSLATQPTLKPRTITYSKWVETFKPVKNHLTPNTKLEGLVFETRGNNLGFVRAANPDCVWTLVEGDSNRWYVVDGYHLINRIGYLITEIPHENHVGGYSIFYL